MAKPLGAVQVRLMGDLPSVEAVAEDLVRRGVMARTGVVENRRNGDWRLYGVIVANEIEGNVIQHPALKGKRS